MGVVLKGDPAAVWPGCLWSFGQCWSWSGSLEVVESLLVNRRMVVVVVLFVSGVVGSSYFVLGVSGQVD